MWIYHDLNLKIKWDGTNRFIIRLRLSNNNKKIKILLINFELERMEKQGYFKLPLFGEWLTTSYGDQLVHIKCVQEIKFQCIF